MKASVSTYEEGQRIENYVKRLKKSKAFQEYCAEKVLNNASSNEIEDYARKF